MKGSVASQCGAINIALEDESMRERERERGESDAKRERIDTVAHGDR